MRVKNDLWRVIQANLRLAHGSHVAIGFPGEAPQSKRLHKSNEGEQKLTMVEVAIRNEFGTAPGVKPGVIARPFIKETVKRHGKELLDGAQVQLRMISRGEQTTFRALSGLGKIGSDRVRDTIDASPSWAAENPPYVRAKKQSTAPLIDSGAMRRAVTYKVRMRGSKRT